MSERTLRRPRLDLVLCRRVGLVVALVVAVASSMMALTTHPRLVPSRRMDPLGPAGRQLLAAATDLSRAWHPRDREAALTRLQNSDQERLRSALQVALARPSLRLRRSLIECAGALRATEVRNEIGAIAAGGGADGAAAVAVVHRLRPCSRAELAEFLANADVRVRIAGLQALTDHSGEWPEGEWMRCLLSEDAEERAAAVRAAPRVASRELLRELENLLAHGQTRGVVQVIRALGRGDGAAQYEAVVTELLLRRRDEVQFAALEFLAGLGSLAQPDRVWEVATESTDARVRAAALHCLERTGAFSVAALDARVVMMTPIERLFAARCLIRAGERKAVELLLGLLDRSDAPEVEESSRRLLAWLTGVSSSAARDDFRAGFARQGDRLRRRHLPAHGLLLDG